ncbi:MAG: hypothetical protein AB8G77_09550 [Rhodothermales bacterium]
MNRFVLGLLTLVVLTGMTSSSVAQERPNIVLVFLDNFGWIVRAMDG